MGGLRCSVNTIASKTVVTKQDIKNVHALGVKKYRDAEGLFVAERPKVVSDLFPLMACQALYATSDYLRSIPSEWLKRVERVEEADKKTIEKLSLLTTPRDVVAVFRKRQAETNIDTLSKWPAEQLCLMLDGVQDPGNLGTIVRLADWFGIEHIFASAQTADVYAPKVVQATMGAIGRVEIHYGSLVNLVDALPKETPLYGTFLEGDNIYESSLTPHGVIIMGNEGKGVSEEIVQRVTHKLFVPPYPLGRATSESLNVAIATAVVCAEFRRRTMGK